MDDLEAGVELAWTGFRQRLADRLAGAAEDDILLVEVETGVDDDELDGAAPYVQFVALGRGDAARARWSATTTSTSGSS